MKYGLIVGGKSEGGIGEACDSWFTVDPRYRDVSWYVPSQNLLDISSDISAINGIYDYVNSLKNTPDFDGFDYIVYAAGVNQLEWATDIAISQMESLYRVNVFGFVSLLGDLRIGFPDKPFSAVAISSDAATNPMRGSVMYCSSKAALDMAVKTMAREWGEDEYRINAVAPGMVDDTPMSKYIEDAVPTFRGWTKERALEYERSMQPMGRRADKMEVANLVADVLYGPRYLNGAIVPLTGAK